MLECVGCRTICCIISFNHPKKRNMCPCVSCIIKVNCLVSCKEYRDLFKVVFGVDMTTNHKARHIYEAYYKSEDRKPRWLVHVHDLNEGDPSSWVSRNPSVLFSNF